MFHYRPLTVDPDIAKRDLYAIDLGTLEDPLLEQLLAEKRREIDAQLTMLATRNTPSFLPASMFLYGSVDKQLIDDALIVLRSTATDPPRGQVVGAQEIAREAERMIGLYRQAGPFDASVEIRNDVAGLLVSGGCLMIGSDTVMPARRLEALLAHEVGDPPAHLFQRRASRGSPSSAPGWPATKVSRKDWASSPNGRPADSREPASGCSLAA